MRGVIGVVVAGQAVDEHGQALALLLEPRHHAVELLAAERDLAAPARMRADQPFVDATHRDRALGGDALAERARLLDGAGVEVDVRVIALVDVLGSARRVGHASILPGPASSRRCQATIVVSP